MWNTILLFTLPLCVVSSMYMVQVEANSSACEEKEKHLAILDLAKESISKAKNIQPTCDNESIDISSNVSECGAKEKVSAYLDIAMHLIDEAKKNYTACEVTTNQTKVPLLHEKPIDCLEILENGSTESGEYIIFTSPKPKAVQVYCDMDTDGGGWTIIQRRGPFSNKVDFYRDWYDYKYGFGNMSEEFWLGNQIIYDLTDQRNYSLRFDMQTVNKENRFATYSSFRIEDENTDYTVHFENYKGTAGDGIRAINNNKFSTKDKRNDVYTKVCTSLMKGGWWYSDCGWSNPNGLNIPEGKANEDNDISSNSQECGTKEKVSAYLDVAMNLIEEAKKNYTACEIELCREKPVDCSKVLENGKNKSGVYTIWPRYPILESKPLKVYCDMDTDGGGWTMIQRRGNFTNKIDFYQDWENYKQGFGNLSEEFWIGNENIFALTNQDNYTIRFDMQTVGKDFRFATYSLFRIENENVGYKLHLANYTGTAGNGIEDSSDCKFSTKDKRNDKYEGSEPCSSSKRSGWWYSDCGQSNPNGVNQPGGTGYSKYMNWYPLTRFGSLLVMDIKIRKLKRE